MSFHMSTQSNVVIVHGTGGSPQGNWFPWIKEKLESKGYNVIAPQYPIGEAQNFDAWLDVFNEQAGVLNPINTILIGHSIGAPFILRMAELSSVPYKALFPICPFDRPLGSIFDVPNATFVEHSFDWEKIKHRAKQSFCYAGDNDPYVPLALSENVADNLNAPLKIIKDGGHLNAEFGYTEFPELLEDILSI